LCLIRVVPSFEVSKYPITNREFLAFVKAGCYQNKSIWTEEGM
jgi:formylglycine-generating enzyme required for sulfatase activity